MHKRQRYTLLFTLLTISILALPHYCLSQNDVPAYSLKKAPAKVFLSDLMMQEPIRSLNSTQQSEGAANERFKNRILDNAFFCALERRIEGKSQLPLRMRLGHLDYVNTLERKNQREAYTFYQIEKHLRK